MIVAQKLSSEELDRIKILAQSGLDILPEECLALVTEIERLNEVIQGINGEWDFQNSLVDRRLKGQEDEIARLRALLEEKR